MWPTIVISAIIIGIVALSIFSLIRDRRNGGCSCGNLCSACSMRKSCHAKDEDGEDEEESADEKK